MCDSQRVPPVRSATNQPAEILPICSKAQRLLPYRVMSHPQARRTGKKKKKAVSTKAPSSIPSRAPTVKTAPATNTNSTTGKKKKKNAGKNAGAASEPKKKSSSESKSKAGGPAPAPAPSPQSAGAAVAAKSSALSKRLGGARLGNNVDAKVSKKVSKATAVHQPKEDLSKKSKIWLALNPQSLYAEDPKKKEDPEEERNIVQVRGGGGMGVLEMEDRMMERDEFGQVIADEDDDEEDAGGFDDDDDGELADFDDETMKELVAKRQAREKEAEERRQLLRKASLKEKAERDKIRAKELAAIEKKKAKERKRDGVTDADVKKAQQAVAKLDFSF